jgi:hypothetical protein
MGKVSFRWVSIVSFDKHSACTGNHADIHLEIPDLSQEETQ